MNEQDDIKGLINGSNTENKDEKNDEDEDDDRYVECEQIQLYSTITNTAKFVSFYWIIFEYLNVLLLIYYNYSGRKEVDIIR